MAKDTNTSPGRISRLLDAVGRTMIVAGLLLLSFVAYQLWGTGIAEDRAQDDMATQFVKPQPVQPQFGGLVGRISIPSIGVSKYVVAGVRLKDLERGPGLFPGSPLPGQKATSPLQDIALHSVPPLAALTRFRTVTKSFLNRGMALSHTESTASQKSFQQQT